MKRTSPRQTVPPVFNEIKRSFIINKKGSSTNTKVKTSVSNLKNVKNIASRRSFRLSLLTRRLSELVNDVKLRLTNDKKDFILGFGGYDDRVIVFGTKQFLQKLCFSDTVFMGNYTIKSKSKLFKHIYTLQCFEDGILVPMVYTILYRNNKKSYSRMLQIIKDTSRKNDLEFDPSYFYIDVDVEIIASIENMFGLESVIKLSLYHYANSIWHKVKSLGLSQNGDENIHKTIRRMCFLAMVPVEHIEETWTKIKSEAPQNENVLELIIYITETFMISDGHTFDKTVWNHYDTDNIIKSLSQLEAWNDFIHTDINESNLSIKNCIIKLKNKHEQYEMDITAYEQLNEVSKIAEKYKNLEEKFQHAKERLENGTISAMEYLDEII